jgi:hypothetical protein
MLTATGWLSDFGHHDESLAAYDKSALAELFVVEGKTPRN